MARNNLTLFGRNTSTIEMTLCMIDGGGGTGTVDNCPQTTPSDEGPDLIVVIIRRRPDRDDSSDEDDPPLTYNRGRRDHSSDDESSSGCTIL
ncbi:hypothetical protein I3843_04G083300 [Carya illinoinensis]|nr:hypothetical protein I3843_04G083300 [Carya illinoinensis]